MDCSLPNSSVHGISQARVLKWVAIFFFRGSSWPRDWTYISWLADRFFTTEPPGKPIIFGIVVVQSLSHVGLSATPRSVACQASLSFTVSWSLLKSMSIESVMLSNISSSVTPFFSCPQSFPASGFLFFASGGQTLAWVIFRWACSNNRSLWDAVDFSSGCAPCVPDTHPFLDHPWSIVQLVPWWD